MVLRILRMSSVIPLLIFVIWYILRDGQREKLSELKSLHTSTNITADKWIVVITNSLPTDAIKTFADQEGWRVVVVADKNAPDEWDYFNCDFLSLEKQKKLNYRIIKHLPSESYSRKMIGYLYAIENGAQWLYDADDQVILTAGYIPFTLL